jgi:DNA-directed RNA polymerase specialized sigma24 family protein
MVYVAKASYISDEEAREIVRLHDQEKKTFKEIAKILGRSVSGVRRDYRIYQESVSRDIGVIDAKLIRTFKND